MLNKHEWAGSEAGFDAIAELMVGLDPGLLERYYQEGVVQGASPLCYLLEELPEDVFARRCPAPLHVGRSGAVLGTEESKAFRQAIVRLDTSLRRLARHWGGLGQARSYKGNRAVDDARVDGLQVVVDECVS